MRYEQFAEKLALEYQKKGLADGKSVPDIDLYIDQMVSCLNSELSLYAKNGEGPITKGIVSNYTKHKMIPGPEGKRYTKDHCIFMLLVYYLKGCFSMDQVQRLMKPILSNYDSAWDDNVDMQAYYKEILAAVRKSEEDFSEQLQERILANKKFLADRGSDDDISELILLITMLIMRSNEERYMAEKLLDEYFPEK
ncbi:MAG: DUF1836 domain-containing protein [Firmicutes bacterium]|jgi:hypothetical protein|nr:DUF1836 domain-containing protein [Bacillota bacterium]MCR4724278.1 DUF1836 domain-containing protein [Clostridia bacterium]MBQ4409946.1 DUF1836 domain-containing protein [Bacillota bacterium]MBQ6295424.1 DUF1836 domain-containing protein [Bacillota bacterium]MBR0051557.1 DUF1836 domain-containing protein [Bacillota bacterium]